MRQMNLTEEQKEVKNLIIIVLIVIAILGTIYLFSRAFISKDLFKSKFDNSKTNEVEFNYDTTIVGSILNRPYTEYYVLVYDKSDNMAFDYENMKNYYFGDLKIYEVDLSDSFNKSYIADKSNLKVEKAEDFRFTKATLLRIKNGKVIKAFEDKSSMKAELGF